MKRAYLKKIMLLIIVVMTFFVLSLWLNDPIVIARDLSLSAPWLGDDLDVTPLQEVHYDSHYVPFNTIIDRNDLIEHEKIYVIESATDLYHWSRLSIGPTRSDFLSLNYVLGKSINYYDAIIENMDYRFHPIGAIDPFTGTFDGQGFEITNLYFQTVMDEETYDQQYPGMQYMAMFSKLSAQAHIHHFGLINPIMIQPIEWRTWRYASYIAGENQGTIDHVYVIDQRKDGAGLHVDGAFHLAGLVSVNQGVMRDMWYASPSVRSRAVTMVLSASPTVTDNSGTLERVYYDQSTYLEEIPTDGIGLSLPSFQDQAYFSNEWYFNHHYEALVDYDQRHLVRMNRTYPTLQGLDLRGKELLIKRPSDFIVMQELLSASPIFRQATYVLTKDLDMKRVAKDAYRISDVSFDGVLKSDPIQAEHVLYNHQSSDGGSPMHYSIFDLSLSTAITHNDRDILSLFHVVFGTIQDMNFRRIHFRWHQQTSASSTLWIAPLAGELVKGRIHNVHVQVMNDDLDAISSYQAIVQAGFIAKASGTIQQSTAAGELTQLSVTFDEEAVLTHSGFIGIAHDLSIEESVSFIHQKMSLIQSTLSYDVMMGGILGHGNDTHLERILFDGIIDQTIDGNNPHRVHLGGIVGLGSGDLSMRSILSRGQIIYQPEVFDNAHISGIGNTFEANFTLFRVLHEGTLTAINPLMTSEIARHQAQVTLSLGLYLESTILNSEGLFNTSSTTINLSFIDRYAGLIIASSSDSMSLVHSQNTGDIDILTTEIIASNHLSYHGLFDVSDASIEHARQLGDLTIHITHSLSSTYSPSEWSISGIFSKLGQTSTARDLFNGGDITITTSEHAAFKVPLRVSGIVTHHQNRQFSIDHHIHPTSIAFDQNEGPMHNILNAGNILIHGSFEHDVDASGIVNTQEGLLTQATNLGQISIINVSVTTQNTIQSSGISSLLVGPHARIMDSANAGHIEAVQLSSLGFAHASGIAIRNDLNADRQFASTTDYHHLAKIVFTINYGDVYAWSESVETNYTITNETRTKSSAILAIGVLSIINNVNYGSIHGKYLASGLIGFLPLNRFGTLINHEVYIANAIQYGQIKAIESFDLIEHTYTLYASTPSRTTYNAYAAMVGKIHTGTSTWAFAGDVMYPIDRIYFGYLLNIDPQISMFANAPELSSTWADGFGNLQQANDVILNMLAYMATTHPNDQSKAPFTYFYQGGWVGQYMGKVIDDYSISEEEGGLFNEGFPFRDQRPIYSGTDQYIRQYIDYIPRDKVNPYIINHLEQTYQVTFPGIYALSSSEGIGQGIFMPDNMDLDRLHPIDPITHEIDDTWLGLAIDPTSIRYQFESRMRQIQTSFASVIYDLTLEQKDASGQTIVGGLTLTSPEIDEARGLITYYLPSNASILLGQSNTVQSVYRFIEVSEGLGRKVPDLVVSGEQTYTWVGNYKKQGDDFVEIGPYHTTGVAMVTTHDQQPVDSYSRNTPVYSRQTLDGGSTLPYIYKHTPHTFVLFVWYASGYRAQVTQGLAPGYGAYEPYTLSGYPTLYRYVGPSRESVTYIRSETAEEVVIYDSSDIYFGVDVDKTSSVLSYGASLSHEGNSYQELASIPRSYGVYEAMYDAQGQYIDSISDHDGKIRVYSSAYQPDDQATYRDYTLRIIRTAPQSIDDVTSLTMNGQSVMPSSYTPNHVESQAVLPALAMGEEGVIHMTYLTYNVANRYDILPMVSLMDGEGLIPIDTRHYALKQGHVTTVHSFENQTGEWKEGSVTIELIIYETLPSGDYRLSLSLITGESYHLYFTKAKSSLSAIQSITYQGITYDDVGSSLETTIPYGLFYDATIESTHIVNFTNLSQMQEIAYDQLDTIIPSYLDALTIDLFSTIESINLSVEPNEAQGYRYILTYHVRAEDGTVSVFTHILNEANPIITPDHIYLSGKQTSDSPIIIQYEESPSLRLLYAFDDLFIYPDTPWSLDIAWTPLIPGEPAIEGIDYVLSIAEGIGFDIDWSKDAPMGMYQITPRYQQSVLQWGMTFDWDLTFSTINVQKIMNHRSTISDILFVSDAIFQGFNTIIDPDYINDLTYQTLLATPSLRKIIQLPTTGILYGQYPDEPVYYAIGQVQQTELSFYQPQFSLPDGAIIKRVIDDVNPEPAYQSDELFADFSHVGESFGYIHYRVYAMDYVYQPTHFTDYYIAVQDMTNTIRFDVTIENQADVAPTSIHVTISLCAIGTPEEPLCEMDDQILSMGWYAHWINGVYVHPVFQSTRYGSYRIDVYLPQGYAYQVMINESTLISDAFYIEHSIFPRKIYVTLIITDQPSEKPWGQHEITPLIPGE